jgi:agmatinase
MTFTLFLGLLPILANAREIVFPSTSGYHTSNDQVILGGYNDPDISQPMFAGLSTYANLPYVHCLAAEGKEVEKFDIAILGAPFDTVSTDFRVFIEGREQKEEED